MSTNLQLGFFRRRTASMEQAVDGAEAAVIDHLFS